jgi:bacterioferritin-associated ferredoxin
MGKTILCHCEDIELEELYSALEQGYGDIETLKRFTGIGTGKCQGKCCFVQTLRLLAELKDGGGEHRGLMGDVTSIRVPTLRPPVLPMRVDDLVEQGDDS